MQKLVLLAAAALAALLAALPCTQALAAPLSDADVGEIRAVIARQIEAFRHGDADEAFVLASPRIRSAFRTPEKFMRDVRTSFAPIARSVSAAFGAVLILDDEVVQQVKLTDRSSRIWRAYYPMQRQRDGTWRANGCQLVREAALSV